MVRSRPIDESSNGEGTRYYLALKLVQLTVDTRPPPATGTAREALALEVLPAIPDLRYGYLATVNHAIRASDDVKIVTTADGLLTSVTSNGDDQTAGILVQLGETARAAAGIDTRKVELVPEDAPQRKGVFVFDPTREDEVDELNESGLHPLGYHLDVVPGSRPTGDGKPPTKGEAMRGIVYRGARAYRIDVSVWDRKPDPLIRAPRIGDRVLSMAVVLPNHGDFFVIPLKAGPMVKTTYTIVFDDGMLTSIQAVRPSELLGAVSVVPDLVSAILAIPTELIQLKIDTTTSEKDLLEAQKALLEAQKALLEAQQDAGSGGDGTGSGGG